jgi:hypothetical protein
MKDNLRAFAFHEKRVHPVASLHDLLLGPTLQNALKTKFYQSIWKDIPIETIDISNIDSLPLVEKEHIRTAGRSAQVREGVICNDVFTTGTTGNPLITVRSDQEQRYIRHFFAKHLERQSNESTYLRGLEFTNPYHGHLVSIPGAIHYHKASIYDAGSFDYGRQTLLRIHCDHGVDKRCSILVGLERCLRAFTLDTISKYPSGFPATGLHIIVSYSQYLTERWRQRLESTWNAPVIDRFGVSEIFGGASQCLACGWYHFEPFVIPEVVGAFTRKTLREGVGLLALTGLYPFQQAQPLVRYLTGDLVEVTYETSCKPGTAAIKPLGRARYGVPEPSTDLWLLTPASILEAVDDITEIRRIPRFADVEQVADPYAIGHPKYRTQCSNGPSCVDVTIEVALSPHLPEARRDDILARILREVIQRNPNFQVALHARTASIAVSACDDVNADLIAQAHSGGVWSPA